MVVLALAVGCGEEADNSAPVDAIGDTGTVDVNDTGNQETKVEPTCGDGQCEAGEDSDTCPDDCTKEWPKFFKEPCTSNADCMDKDGQIYGYCIEVDEFGTKECTFGCIDECPEGYGCTVIQNVGESDAVLVCTKIMTSNCDVCESDEDCQYDGAQCIDVGLNAEGPERRCAMECGDDGWCDDGYECKNVAQPGEADAVNLCVPSTGSCICFGQDDQGNDINGSTRACETSNDVGTCAGQETCAGEQGWSGCDAAEAAEELCDGLDNDCNDTVDDGFVDTDKDGQADCVDEDDDGDGTDDDEDNCPLIANSDQLDTDKDGIGDACEGECQGESTCSPGATSSKSCGKCGTKKRKCTNQCEWGDYGECTGQGTCKAGSPSPCGNCGTKTCSDECTWGGCADEGVCKAGETSPPQDCGNCGTQTKMCTPECVWALEPCNDAGNCKPGTIGGTPQACGNCGTQEQECTSLCEWGENIGECTGQGECKPGTPSAICGDKCKTKTCSNECTWTPCVQTVECSENELCNKDDGKCECDLSKGYKVTGDKCLPSCGTLKKLKGEDDNTQGCCTKGCKGKTIGGPGTTYDCNYCCESFDQPAPSCDMTP